MNDAPLCRSTSPQPTPDLAGLPCVKPRGHKSRMHSNPAATKRWEDGINKTARWEIIDDDHYSEGDYEAMRQSGVRW